MADGYPKKADPGLTSPPAGDTRPVPASHAGAPGVRGEEAVKAHLAAVVSREIEDAREFIDHEIGELRAKATEYYNGEPFGNEEEGRSSVQSRDVRDSVLAMMPSLMRIFFGGTRVGEFRPRRADAIPGAEQATDYINDVVLTQDNDGFTEVYSAIKDALVRKVGILKWWWDKRVRLEATQHSGLLESELIAFADDPEVEKVEVEQTSEEGIEPRLFTATVHRRIEDGRARFKCLPGEQFLIDRRATSIDDAVFVAHRDLVTVSDLVAMGYDYDEVVQHATFDNEFDTVPEFNSRMPYATEWGTDSHVDPMLRKVMYVESYVYAKVSEADSDPAQLVKVCAVGLEPIHILSWEPVDERPFAALCPDPEPHVFFGNSIADVTMDIQLIKSAVLRSTLDSLTLSLYPRVEIVDGAVNIQDLLNPELGGIIRTTAPGQMREVKVPFVGADALPVLQYLDEIRENRTKLSKASQGLDADVLQSTTKAAVTSTMSAAQAQIELVARIFAETGFKRLLRGLLKLTIRHQDRPRTVRLRGQYVEVDPKSWDAEMDVAINVALGAGGPEEKLAVLAGIAEKQETILSTLGPNNPLVTLKQYRNTLAEMVKLAGWKDPSMFWQEVPDAPPGGGEAAPPTEDPAAKLAEAQRYEVDLKMQIEREKLALEREKMMLQDERERLKIATDAQVKIAVAEAQHQIDINNAAVNAEIEALRAQLEAANRQREIEADTAALMAAQAPEAPNVAG